MALVRQTLADLHPDATGILRIYRPQPTAAFSPRDTIHPRHAQVSDMVRERGFEPVERRAGGQLAVYDEGALVVDIVAAHANPRENTIERFRLLSACIASALSAAGLDARVGSIANEYCPGDFSVNAGGRIKLVGLAQRIGRSGYHMGAVIAVERSERACAAVAEAYALMDIPFDPATFGALSDVAPGLGFETVSGLLRPALDAHFEFAWEATVRQPWRV